MAGLRERQKETRRKDMLSAATSLFAKRGYDAVKLEEIAESAGVSPGTLYTYFKTKNDLLLAVIVDDFDLGLSIGQEAIHGPHDDAVSAVNKFIRAHYLHRVGGPTNEMWRFAIAAHMRYMTSHFGIEYQKCLDQMYNQLVALIDDLKHKKHLPASVDSTELADLLDGVATRIFLDQIRKDQNVPEEMFTRQDQLNAQLISWARSSN